MLVAVEQQELLEGNRLVEDTSVGHTSVEEGHTLVEVGDNPVEEGDSLVQVGDILVEQEDSLVEDTLAVVDSSCQDHRVVVLANRKICIIKYHKLQLSMVYLHSSSIFKSTFLKNDS